jgi:hypothetical protein
MSKLIHEIAIEAVYLAARARPANDGLRVYCEANPRGATHDELIAAYEFALLGGGGSALLCSNPFGRLSEGRRVRLRRGAPSPPRTAGLARANAAAAATATPRAQRQQKSFRLGADGGGGSSGSKAAAVARLALELKRSFRASLRYVADRETERERKTRRA